MSVLKIAYISVSDPKDKHAWSGTAHYIYEACRKHLGVIEVLGPAEPFFATWICKIIHGFSLLLFKKRFDYRHSTFYSKSLGRLFDKKLNKKSYELIIAPAGVACTAYLKSKIPVIIVADRAIEGALNYHTILSNLWAWSQKQSVQTDKTAMQNSLFTAFSSKWAADTALINYKVNPDKIKILPFGANMDNIPSKEEIFKRKEKTTVCKLLLIGTEWKNKGADIALNTLNELLKMGVEAHLTICGCTPPTEINHKHLTIIPFLNKNTTDGRNKLEALFLSHTFFILPTRFDCTPIVFCEASAYALPVISANTGGVAGHVKEGINGYLIKASDTGKAYAEKIKTLHENKTEYKRLCESSRNFYEKELNWDSWAKTIKEILKIKLNRPD